MFHDRTILVGLVCVSCILVTLPSSNAKDSSPVRAESNRNASTTTTKDEDYSAVEDEITDEDGNSSSNRTIGTSGKDAFGEFSLAQKYLDQLRVKSQTPAKSVDDTHANDNTAGIITNMSDIVKLVRFVFLRGHIVLDASHRVIVKNESRIERLLDYLHDIQLRRGKHRVLPMDDRDLGCEDIPDSKLHLKELCNAATFDCLSASELPNHPLLVDPSILTITQFMNRPAR